MSQILKQKLEEFQQEHSSKQMFGKICHEETCWRLEKQQKNKCVNNLNEIIDLDFWYPDAIGAVLATMDCEFKGKAPNTCDLLKFDDGGYILFVEIKAPKQSGTVKKKLEGTLKALKHIDETFSLANYRGGGVQTLRISSKNYKNPDTELDYMMDLLEREKPEEYYIDEVKISPARPIYCKEESEIKKYFAQSKFSPSQA